MFLSVSMLQKNFTRSLNSFQRNLLSVPYPSPGNQGNFWKSDMASTGAMDRNFQFVIEGKRGTSFRGDISIDDISFADGCVVDLTGTLDPNPITPSPPPGCVSGQFSCTDGTCISADDVCNFRKDCTNGYDELSCPAKCDYESGTMCKWYNYYWNDVILDWKLHLAGNPSENGTGPPTDHTLSSAKGNIRCETRIVRYLSVPFIIIIFFRDLK